jgi:hypothetical protein
LPMDNRIDSSPTSIPREIRWRGLRTDKPNNMGGIMKKYLLYGIMCVFLIVISGYFALAQEHGGPKMVVKERKFDFGEVKEGEIIEHTFQVLNRGDQTLEIEDVRPG